MVRRESHLGPPCRQESRVSLLSCCPLVGAREKWRSIVTTDVRSINRFRTAFVTYEEHCVVAEIFGEPDVVANDLEEVARRIIEWEEARQKE